MELWGQACSVLCIVLYTCSIFIFTVQWPYVAMLPTLRKYISFFILQRRVNEHMTQLLDVTVTVHRLVNSSMNHQINGKSMINQKKLHMVHKWYTICILMIDWTSKLESKIFLLHFTVDLTQMHAVVCCCLEKIIEILLILNSCTWSFLQNYMFPIKDKKCRSMLIIIKYHTN